MAKEGIELIKDFELNTLESENLPKLSELFSGPGRRMVEVNLLAGDILAKHKASEPISVFCIAGSGIFRAGKDLEHEQLLSPGTLITLDADVEHDVRATPAVRLLVTKFKRY